MRRIVNAVIKYSLKNNISQSYSRIIPNVPLDFNFGCFKNNKSYFTVETGPLTRYKTDKDSTSYVNKNEDFNNECSNIEHKVVDIMDDKSVSSVGVLSTQEFLSTKRTNLIGKDEYDNLKPHEVKKYISSKQDEYYTYDKTETKQAPNESKVPKYENIIEKSKLYPNSQPIDKLSRKDGDDKLLFQNEKLYEKSSEDYYKSFFKDRERVLDGYDKQISSIENNILNGNGSTKNRTRISPLKYWIKPNYQSPHREEIQKLDSFDLKFVMMNEAKLYTYDNVINEETWDSLLDRALAVNKVSNIRTLLRFLHSISIPRVNNPKVKELIDVIYKRKYELKPKQYVYLFQALSRLKIRDQRLSDDLYEMILSWPVLRNNFIIKAANSLSKLGLADNVLTNPLKDVVRNRFQDLSGRECKRIKPITIMEMFSDDMIVEFLNRCEYNKSYFTDSVRNMVLIELYLRLLKPDVYDNLNNSTKKFLNTLREYGKNNEELINKFKKDPTMTSEHEDISRILSILNVNHQNCIPAGQINLDIYESFTNTVIEINNKYQYYQGTTQLTSLAKRRHDLISAMGFRLLHIPYRWWNMLESDENKIEQIKKMFINL